MKQECKDCTKSLDDCTCIEDTIELKDAAERHSNETLRDNSHVSFIEGAKWQQERSYSEEEVIDIAKQAFVLGKDFGLIGTFNEWFDTVKKK